MFWFKKEKKKPLLIFYTMKTTSLANVSIYKTWIKAWPYEAEFAVGDERYTARRSRSDRHGNYEWYNAATGCRVCDDTSGQLSNAVRGYYRKLRWSEAGFKDPADSDGE